MKGKQIAALFLALMCASGQAVLADCKGGSVPGQLGCQVTDALNNAARKADDVNAGIAAQKAADALAQERSREAAKILEQSIAKRNDDIAKAAQEAAARNARQTWMRNQAHHSWEQRASSWQKRGINDANELQSHLSGVRTSPDIQKQLNPTPTGGPKTVYGQYSDSTKTGGTVLIDNPQAQNGGTAFPHRDINARITQLK